MLPRFLLIYERATRMTLHGTALDEAGLVASMSSAAMETSQLPRVLINQLPRVLIKASVLCAHQATAMGAHQAAAISYMEGLGLFHIPQLSRFSRGLY